MKRNIKIESNLNIMNKIFIFISILSFSLLSVNSAVNYPIDEGFGGVIFDTQNVGMNGVSSTPKDTYWTAVSKHGLYSINPKPGKFINILINNYPQLTPQTNFTLELEYMVSDLAIVNPLSKLGAYDFVVDGATMTGTFTFYTGLVPNIVPILNITPGTINSLFLTWNGTHYFVYSGNVSQTPLGIAQILPLDININPLNLFNNNFGGLIDEFEIYDFYSNQTDINFHEQSLTAPIPNGNGTTGLIVTELIKSYAPIPNQSFTENALFEMRLNQVGTCNLYVDNNFHKTYSNILTMTDTINFANDYGNHSYFFNCFNNDFNEMTNDTLFSVSKTGNTQLRLTFSGSDFNVNSIPLEIVTPCLNKGYTLAGMIDGYRPVANIGGAQFKDVVNGEAIMTLPQGEHEFCLIHGLVTYGTYNHTNQWTANSVIKQVELGKFNLPNNITTSYNIALDNFDVYDKTDPKAWGQTWVTLISSIIAFVLGLAILGAGATTGSGQAVMIGGLLLLFSLGYQMSNVVLGVVILKLGKT